MIFTVIINCCFPLQMNLPGMLLSFGSQKGYFNQGCVKKVKDRGNAGSSLHLQTLSLFHTQKSQVHEITGASKMITETETETRDNETRVSE